MDFVEQLLEHFKKPAEETKDQTPEGVCPACWGFQEYDHKIRVLLKDEQIDVIHHQKKYMLIRKFVKDHIDGIRLLEPEVHDCPTCGANHEKENHNQ